MIKLNSLQVTTAGLSDKENLIIGPDGSPLFCWLEDGVLTTLKTSGNIWPPQTTTTSTPAGYVKVGVYGNNYLMFFINASSDLKCVEYSNDNVFFYDEVTVASSVNLFDVTRDSEEIKVAYTIGGKIYVAGRNNDSRVWDVGTEVVSEASDITSVSIDYKEDQLVVAYTTSARISAYQDPETYPFPTISLTGVPSDVKIRSIEADSFHLIYNQLSANRSIEHIVLSEGTYSEDQIVDDSNDNYNIDLFSSSQKICVVFVQGGYVRYREWNGTSWDDLVGATYIGACDADSTPKVIYYESSTGYSRTVYRLGGNLYYAGLIPYTQNIYGYFDCSVWGITKYIDNGATSVNSPLAINRLSQRVIFTQQTLSIGGVSCYLKKIQDESALPFSVTMSIYYSDINGDPYATPLASSTISSSNLPDEGWVEFPFSMDNMLSPIDGYCFVMMQSSGDENNFASWMGYVDTGTGARISKDGTTWVSVDNITRSIKARGNFNAYEKIINSDPSQITHQIVTPPAVESIGNQVEYEDLVLGEFDNTKLIDVREPDYYTPPEPVDQDARIYGYAGTISDWRVVLEDQNLIVSFVVDSSGSAGWNDIFDLRHSIVSDLIEKLKTKTGSTILFDFVKFGGMLVDQIDVSLSKRVEGFQVSVDDYTDVSGYDSEGNPITTSNVGQVRDHLQTGVVAYGFKNLKATDYIFYELDLGWKKKTFTSVDNNWHTFWTSGQPSFSTALNGPDNETSLNITVSDVAKNVARFFSAYEKDMLRKAIVSNISIGDTDFYVSDITGISEGKRVNLIDPDYINSNFYISEVDTDLNFMTSARTSDYDFSTADAFIETFKYQFMETGWEDTNVMEFFLVDENDSGNISFFIQTYSGATFEYEVEPMTSWTMTNLYFLDETADFEVNAVNSLGENMPDGTKVEFYVNKNPERRPEDVEDPQQSYLLTQDGTSGSTVVYLSSSVMDDFAVNEKVEITDDTKSYDKQPGAGGVLFTYIKSIGTDYLEITDALPEDFLMSNTAKVLYPATKTEENNFKLISKMNINANLVDVTPIYKGRKLDPSLFTDLDRIQVEPTDGYDDHNSDPDQVRRNSIEVLLTDGYSALRLLPVTEDYFIDSDLKKALSKSMFNISAREQVELNERNNAISSSTTSETSSEQSSSSSEEELWYEPPLDFQMEHETYVSNGYAATAMHSYATALEEATYNGKKYLAKEYTIYTVMTFFKSDGMTPIAQMFLPQFDVAFACPVSIVSTADSLIDFECKTAGEDPQPYTNYCAGDYAMGGKEITITYAVNYKDFPMQSGELEINIYDLRRDVNSAETPDEILGDVNGCGDLTSAAGGDLLYSSNISGGDAYDQKIEKMILATDYFDEDFDATQTLAVTRGVATITLPVIERIALFEIHAIYRDSANTKVVHKQRVYYRSPLRIYYTGPSSVVADNITDYELSAELKWLGVDNVEDGTIVNFQTSGGELKPSISETESGIAEGVLFRPYPQVVTPTEEEESAPAQEEIADQLTNQKKEETRTVKISSSYNGFVANIDAVLKIGETVEFGDFYFMCRPFPDSIFADGVDVTTVVSDLQESYDRGFPYVDVVAPYLLNSICLLNGSYLSATKTEKWKIVDPASLTGDKPPADTYADPTTLPYYSWADMTAHAVLGRPVFVPAPDNNDGPPPCNIPCVEINAMTKTRGLTPDVIGKGIDSYTVSFISETPSGEEKIPKPRIQLKEPLGLDLSFEPIDRSEYQAVTWRQTPLGSYPATYSLDEYSHPTKRDGKALYYVVAEVTFKDQFIFGTSDNPFPYVYFKSGKLVIESDDKSYSYEFTEDNDWKISDDRSIVSIARTTFNESHFHECYVDESGVGKTTATISYNKGYVVSDHVHTIDINSSPNISYELATITSSTTVQSNHTHTPRSVAIISSGPSTDISLEVAVQGIVTYNAGKALAADDPRSMDNYALSYPADNGSGSEETYEEQYFLEISTPEDKVEDALVPSFKTSSSRHEAGHLITLHAWKKTNTGEELPLPDGTRIFTSFKFFQPPNQEQIEADKVLIIDQEKVREYAIMEINARISGLPVDVSATKQVLIRSDKYWFPYISNTIFDSATSDQLYLDSAIASLGEFGGSQIADALIFAANRIIELGTDYDSWKKTFVLISDGGENLSENSLDQACESVNAINGDGECKIFSVKLFDTELFDNVIMQKYASNTSGEFIKVGQIIGTVDQTSDQVTDEILSSDKFDILTGTYSNIIDLTEYKKFKGCRFGVLIKVGTSIKFRVRFSNDGINYGPYSILPSKTYDGAVGEILQWYIVEFDNIDSFGRYMEYELTLKGSIETFESPMFSGVRYEYYEPGKYTMFFQPIEIEDSVSYAGEIIFVHEGTIPETSTIKYGINHDNSTDFNSVYYSDDQPLFNGGVSGIVLSRFNEKTTTSDYKTYFAVNGRWNDAYEVKVYRCNEAAVKGIEVVSEDYTIDSQNGSITFQTVQPFLDNITFTITMKPYFRVAVSMTNYTTDTIILDNVSFMYNLVNRNNLAPAGDHRDVSSLVKTDLSSFNISSLGTLEDGYILGNSKVGNDTDILIDLSQKDLKYYLLAYNGTEPYVVEMEPNLTILKTYYLTGKNDFIPISLSNDGINWFFSERSSSGVTIHKFDSAFKFVDTFSSELDFLESGSTFLNVKRLGLRWYMTDNDRFYILNKSLLEESYVLLPFEINGPFALTNNDMFFVSQFKDVIFKADWNGNPKAYYNIFDAKEANNIAYLDDKFYFISDTKMTRMNLV